MAAAYTAESKTEMSQPLYIYRVIDSGVTARMGRAESADIAYQLIMLSQQYGSSSVELRAGWDDPQAKTLSIVEAVKYAEQYFGKEAKS